MSTTTTNPPRTSGDRGHQPPNRNRTDADTIRDLQQQIREVRNGTTGLRSEIDQLRAGHQDVVTLRQALEQLLDIVARYDDASDDDLEAQLQAVRDTLQGATAIVLKQAERAAAGNAIDSDALDTARVELQAAADKLAETASEIRSRLERLETTLEMTDTGRSGRLDRHEQQLRAATEATDHVNTIRALLGVGDDGKSAKLDALGAAQEATATAVGNLTKIVTGHKADDGTVTPGLVQRVEALEQRRNGASGRSFLIGGLVAFVLWLILVLAVPIPVWAEFVFAITTFLVVSGLLIAFGGSNPHHAQQVQQRRRVQRLRPAQNPDNATTAPLPRQQ